MQKKSPTLSASILTIILVSLISFIIINSTFTNALAQPSPSKESYHFVRQWGSEGSDDEQFVKLEGIAVDSSGNVYVSDSFNYRVQKFDSNGNFITKWGSGGKSNGQFEPRGIAVDSSGNVYVSDSFNYRVQSSTATATSSPSGAQTGRVMGNS